MSASFSKTWSIKHKGYKKIRISIHLPAICLSASVFPLAERSRSVSHVSNKLPKASGPGYGWYIKFYLVDGTLPSSNSNFAASFQSSLFMHQLLMWLPDVALACLHIPHIAASCRTSFYVCFVFCVLFFFFPKAYSSSTYSPRRAASVPS